MLYRPMNTVVNPKCQNSLFEEIIACGENRTLKNFCSCTYFGFEDLFALGHRIVLRNFNVVTRNLISFKLVNSM